MKTSTWRNVMSDVWLAGLGKKRTTKRIRHILFVIFGLFVSIVGLQRRGNHVTTKTLSHRSTKQMNKQNDTMHLVSVTSFGCNLGPGPAQANKPPEPTLGRNSFYGHTLLVSLGKQTADCDQSSAMCYRIKAFPEILGTFPSLPAIITQPTTSPH